MRNKLHKGLISAYVLNGVDKVVGIVKKSFSGFLAFSMSVILPVIYDGLDPLLLAWFKMFNQGFSDDTLALFDASVSSVVVSRASPLCLFLCIIWPSLSFLGNSPHSMKMELLIDNDPRSLAS